MTEILLHPIVRKQIKRCLEGGGKKGYIKKLWRPASSQTATDTLRLRFTLDDDPDNPTTFGWVLSPFTRQFNAESMAKEGNISELMGCVVDNSNVIASHQNTINAFMDRQPIHFNTDGTKLTDQAGAIANSADVFTSCGLTKRFKSLIRSAKTGSTTTAWSNDAYQMLISVYSVTPGPSFYEPEEKKQQSDSIDITGSGHDKWGGEGWTCAMEPTFIKRSEDMPNGALFGRFFGSVWVNNNHAPKNIRTGRRILLGRTDNLSNATTGIMAVNACVYSQNGQYYRTHFLLFTLDLQGGQLSVNWKKIWAQGIGGTKVLQYPTNTGPTQNGLAGCSDDKKMSKYRLGSVSIWHPDDKTGNQSRKWTCLFSAARRGTGFIMKRGK